MPGIAGLETIQTFHNAKMIGDPRSTWGNLEDNPVQDMAREVNRMCKPDFMLNVALNKSKEITAAFAGEVLKHIKKDVLMLKNTRCLNAINVLMSSSLLIQVIL